MRRILFAIATLAALTCHGQQIEQSRILSVSPAVDKSDKINRAIINALTDFLATKNASLTQNRNWSSSDFKKYVYPYIDIYDIEKSKYGNDYFKPTLMEIITTENPLQKVVKIAFIGHNSETQENQLRSIFNIMANIEQENIRFSRYLDYATAEWSTV